MEKSFLIVLMVLVENQCKEWVDGEDRIPLVESFIKVWWWSCVSKNNYFSKILNSWGYFLTESKKIQSGKREREIYDSGLI